MKLFFTMLSLICLIRSAFSQDKVLFEVGVKDSKSSEFSLSPNQYDSFLAHFSGEPTYYVGYSLSMKQWPYVLPGPRDHWAGGG